MTVRLRSRLAARADYTVFVGVPLAKPDHWARAIRYTADEIATVEGRYVVDDIAAFIVAYPNRQLVDTEALDLGIPTELTGLDPLGPPERVSLDIEAATRGLAIVEIRYGSSAAHPSSPSRYRTTLKNVSNEPVRILRFGGFLENDGKYELNTVTGKLFSAEEFVAWYDAPADGWIPPGGEVADLDNYGGPPVMWAYFGKTKSGREFVAGKRLLADWKLH